MSCDYPWNDFEVAARIKAGNELAFRQVYDRYWDKIYTIARNRLDNVMEAEEIVQEIFTDLWNRRSSFTLLKGFDNYFSVAVKFKVINCLARRARAAEYTRDYAARYSDADNSLLSLLDYREATLRLAGLVRALPEKCRIVYELQHERGYSLRQIAEELNISEKTVEAHLTKARRTLQGAFELLVVVGLALSAAGLQPIAVLS